MTRCETVGIVGAGIVGLAHAWMAAERGHRVRVFERSTQAQGASIRNFGMVWPIGQPPGALHQTALRSRARWLQAEEQAGVWVNRCGSLHVAQRDDEQAVLEEFAALAPGLGYESRWLTAAEVRALTPAADLPTLCGGLFSPTELGVNPGEALRGLAAWLAAAYHVEFRFQTAVVAAETGRLTLADGSRYECDRIVICSGSDFETLFPERLAAAGMKRCKLQMLRTVPQPAGFQLGPHLASGLTLRHYRNFEVCPSLPALCRRVAEETPELDHYGIHVMASQLADGSLILGDSHEYDGAIDPFDKAEIDELMLRELRRQFVFPEWRIAARWHGIYAKHPTLPIVRDEPQPGVFVRTGTGGAGMTMSFGLAEEDWIAWS